jgi:hypothetical protein
MEQLREYTEPLSEFQEGQWWVNELDALVKKEGTTDDQKRAVAVVHHMLRSAALASAPVADERKDYCPEKRKPGGCQLHNLHCGYPKCNEPPAPSKDVQQDTGNPEADRLIGRLMSSDPDFDDCAAAAQLIRLLASEVQTTSPVDENLLMDQEDAKRWRWLWNNAHNVSFSYKVNQYTTSVVQGLHCGSLKDSVDSAMKN